MKKLTPPNPAGREGKPISLAPHSFDDALRKILSAPPPPKQEKPKEKKRRTKKA
jgi:hypothetical protein